MILEDQNPVDEQFQIVSLQLVLFLNVAEDVDGSLGRAVQLNDGVPLVGKQIDLVIQTVYLFLQLRLHLVIKGFQVRFVFRVLHDVPNALALGDLQFFIEIIQHLRQKPGMLRSVSLF